MNDKTMPLLKRDDILRQIDETLELCESELLRLPTDIALKTECSALESLQSMVMDHWPLKPEEKAAINIGIYAVRELEGINDELVAKLTTLEQRITRA